MKCRLTMLVLMALALSAPPARAQRAALETLTDVELWKTDAGSRLLSSNDGKGFAEGRIHGFGVLRAGRMLELRGISEIETSTESDASVAFELELLSLRFFPSRAFVLEAGKINMPIGSFGLRRFSNTNPLIGKPDLYPESYPLGASVSGGIGRVDYHAALVSLPPLNEDRFPEPSKRLRPIVGVGFAASPAFRAGVSVTHGAYLGSEVVDLLPAGTALQDYQQTVVATDFHFSAGYLDTRAEVAWSSYDVPTVASPVHGLGGYIEARYAHTPRIFSALRIERNRYPFVRPVTAAQWIGNAATEFNAEAGIGYRMTQATLWKVSLRRDYWPGTSLSSPDGYALSMQFSALTNIVGLFARAY